jgi:O-antigen/teichoic acid export membrane protein
MNLGRKMRTLKDAFLTYSTVLVNQAISMLAAIAITRSLGLVGKGQIELLLNVPDILLIIGMIGSSQAIVFHIGKRNLSFEDLISSCMVLSLIQAFVLALLGISLWHFMSNNLLRGLDVRYLILILILLPANILFEYNVSIFRGINRPALYNLYRFIRVVIYFLGIALIWVIGRATTGSVLIVYSIALIVTLIWSQVVLLKLHTKPIILSISSLWKSIMIVIGYGIQIYPTLVIAWLGYRIDTFLLNAILDQKSVGVYSIAVSIAEAAWYLPNAVGIVILPRISQMSDDEANKFTPLVLRQVGIIMFATVIGLFVFGRPIILFAFGKAADLAVIPLYCILPGIFCFATLKIIWQDLCGRGHPMLASLPMIISLVVDVIFVVVLTPIFGVSGTAFASTISYTTAAILALVVFMKMAKVSLREIVTFTEQDKQIYRQLYFRVRSIFRDHFVHKNM